MMEFLYLLLLKCIGFMEFRELIESGVRFSLMHLGLLVASAICIVEVSHHLANLLHTASILSSAFKRGSISSYSNGFG